jgi:hypothetical protein
MVGTLAGGPEGLSEESRAPHRVGHALGAITFTRPEPTKFVLLVAKTGHGTGTVVGTESFKPSSTEWATEQDLLDAGYVPWMRCARALDLLRALQVDLSASPPGAKQDGAWLHRVLAICTILQGAE